MGKLRRKRIINRKAGSRDLLYVLRDDGKCPYQTRHEELTHISDHTLLAIHFVGATGYLSGEWFLHSDVAYRDYSCCSMCEFNITLFVSMIPGPRSIHTLEKVDSREPAASFIPAFDAG